MVEQTLDPLLPLSGTSSIVIHHRRAMHVDSIVVGPLLLVWGLAPVFYVNAIKHFILLADKIYGFFPGPNLLRPVGIMLLASISSETCGDVEEASIRHSVLVI